MMVDTRLVSLADLHEEEIESRYEATFAVGLVIGLQVTLALVSLAGGWTPIRRPGTSSSLRTRIRHSPNRAGARDLPTTCMSRSPTQ
jgi:hypothetical protein